MSITEGIIERSARAMYDINARGRDPQPTNWEDLNQDTTDYWLALASASLSAVELDLRIHFLETTLAKMPPAALDYYLGSTQAYQGPVQSDFTIEILRDSLTGEFVREIRTSAAMEDLDGCY